MRDRASEVAGFLLFTVLDLGLVHIAPCALLLQCRGDWALVIYMDKLSLVAPPVLDGRVGFRTILGLFNLDLLLIAPVAYRGALVGD